MEVKDTRGSSCFISSHYAGLFQEFTHARETVFPKCGHILQRFVLGSELSYRSRGLRWRGRGDEYCSRGLLAATHPSTGRRIVRVLGDELSSWMLLHHVGVVEW